MVPSFETTELAVDGVSQLALAVLPREVTGSGPPLDPFVLVAGPDVSGRQRKEITGRRLIDGFAKRVERGDGRIQPSQCDLHPAKIEPGDAKRRLRVQRP